MSTTLSDHLVTDDLTVLLGLVAATVFLLNNLYKPQPLVHPILLGRQSDVGRARNPGESAIYRNYSTGLMGRFPARPNKDVNVLGDLVKTEIENARTLWQTKITNLHLQDRVAALATGFVRHAGLRPKDSHVFLLVNDSLEFILADLALASLSIVSYTVSSSTAVSSIFDKYRTSAIVTNAEFVPHLLDLIYKSDARTNNYTIIVVGEVDYRIATGIVSNLRILRFNDVERDGYRMDKVLVPAPSASDVFSVAFYGEQSGDMRGVQFTHENITAGVAAVRALLPSASAFSTLDTIVSAHSLSSIYGRVIAYTAIYEGTSFTTLPGARPYGQEMMDDLADVISYKRYPIPSPTLLFIKPGHLEEVVSRIHEEASKSYLYSLAMRHKKSGIAEGFVSKESLWDRLVFDGARAKILGEGAGTLRSVIVGEGFLAGDKQTKSRIALSVPLISCFTHAVVAGPVLSSHAYDLQALPVSGKAHVGPPSVNVEVKLTGVDDEAVEKGGDPVGMAVVRGPSVGAVDGLEDGWAATGTRFRVQANGAFQAV
ncbi:hypothetical protein AX15_000965 [Amanita polypyramis BW_CC]|nr:hypothetical protein AX15_000965 [Amanita polypyramis BW_CC]